jgi:hypothetical protein
MRRATTARCALTQATQRVSALGAVNWLGSTALAPTRNAIYRCPRLPRERSLPATARNRGNAAYRTFRRMVRDSLANRGVVYPEGAFRADLEIAQRTSVASKTGQLCLVQIWRTMLRQKEPLPSFGDVEFRAFSQNGEDGIVLYIFGRSGPRTRFALKSAPQTEPSAIQQISY